ncbi:MAG: hypothetical protein ACO2ON_03905 [Candidatus Nanopusillus sp.]
MDPKIKLLIELKEDIKKFESDLGFLGGIAAGAIEDLKNKVYKRDEDLYEVLNSLNNIERRLTITLASMIKKASILAYYNSTMGELVHLLNKLGPYLNYINKAISKAIVSYRNNPTYGIRNVYSALREIQNYAVAMMEEVEKIIREYINKYISFYLLS